MTENIHVEGRTRGIFELIPRFFLLQYTTIVPAHMIRAGFGYGTSILGYKMTYSRGGG